MQTVPIELPDKLAVMLDNICLESGRLKQELVRELVIQYLEDLEDVMDAERVAALNEPGIPLEQVRRELGLEN